MNTFIYTIGIIVAVVAALVGTIWVAKNPADKNYGSVKKRLRNLSVIYVVVTVLSLMGFVLYLFA